MQVRGKLFASDSSIRRAAALKKKDRLLRPVNSSTSAECLREEISSRSTRPKRYKAKATQDNTASSTSSSTMSVNVLDRKSGLSAPINCDATINNPTRTQTCRRRRCKKRGRTGAVRGGGRRTG